MNYVLNQKKLCHKTGIKICHKTVRYYVTKPEEIMSQNRKKLCHKTGRIMS